MIKLLINGHLVQLTVEAAQELQQDLEVQINEYYSTEQDKQEPGILYREE